MRNDSTKTLSTAASTSAPTTATTGVADVAWIDAVNTGDSPPPVIGVEAGPPQDLEVCQP